MRGVNAVLSLQALVIDDHAVVRAGVAALLAAAHPGSEVLEADGLLEARELLATRPGTQLAVLDLHLPDLAPLAALRALRSEFPLLPVLMMSADEDAELAAQALREGAAGWVTKGADRRALLAAVEQVLAGGCAVPPFLARSSPQMTGETLTERQLEVLAELVEGRSNKDIARRLGLAEPTVKAHLVSIFRVLHARNRAQAALAGRAHLASLAKFR
jgi:DNA-binding NarL/FixJ family response regulator